MHFNSFFPKQRLRLRGSYLKQSVAAERFFMFSTRIAFALSETAKCQQALRAKHLLTSAPARIATKNVHDQQVLRAKHLLTSAPTKIATKNMNCQ